jgi:hypothetical protein
MRHEDVREEWKYRSTVPNFEIGWRELSTSVFCCFNPLKYCHIYWIQGRVGPRDDLNAVDMGTIPWPCRESNLGSAAV